MPELSIIILTWNTAEITKKCVLSIEKYLKNKIDYEIIVADNNSTDNTQKTFQKLKSVRYIRHSQNFGFSKGNNLAAQKARGQYFFFLNSDMELVDSDLVNMLQYFKKHPKIGIIGPAFLNTDLTPQGSVFPPQTIQNAFKEFWLGKSTYSKYSPKTEKPTKVWSISGGAILIRQSLFKKIGGWNTKYFMFYEDLDLCRQVRKHGQKIYYYPKLKVVHHHGASGKNLTDTDNQWRRLIPSSKLYHGHLKHYLLFLVIWSGQKWQKIKRLFE